MDLLILFIGAALLATSVILKLDVLFMAAFLVAAFNDFAWTAMIQKKQDERAALIKVKADGITYFITLGLLVILLGLTIKRSELFGSVPQLLCFILTAVCLIHSLALSVFGRKY